MKTSLVSLVLVGALLHSAHGYGYIFSRFRPEAGGPWTGYGGAGLQSPQERLSPRQQLMDALNWEEILEEEVCNGRRCTSNEHCCPGHICIDFGSKSGGSCMPVESQRESECSSNLDCGDGHVCELGLCAVVKERKGYNELCVTSSECDLGKGLCCQVIRRHRQAPRKLCSYFKDPLSCIGHVGTEVKRSRPSQ